MTTTKDMELITLGLHKKRDNESGFQELLTSDAI